MKNNIKNNVMTSVYIRRDLYEQAKRLRLNVSAVTDMALEQIIREILERGDDPAFRFLFFNRAKESGKQTVEQGGT